MHSVLVTGGAGFIGSNFIHFLLRVEPETTIINLDALTYAGSMENLKGLPDPERHMFVKGDICDRALIDELLRKHKIDTIIHFAAETHVDRSIIGPGQFIQTNIIGTFTLLDAARIYWLEEKLHPIDNVRFHHVSTDEVYGTLALDEPAWTEEIPYSPNSPYAASKAASDHLVRSYYHTYQLPVTITNCSNNYGPRQFPEKLIPLMVYNALNGKPLPIYGDGKQIRDWLYVEDHCEAIWHVVRKAPVGETYNIGGGNQPTNLDLVRFICGILDEKAADSPHRPHASLLKYVKDRPGHDRRYAMDITKIGIDLGWEPRQWLESGLEKTVEWYLNNPEWIAAVNDQADHQEWLEKNYQQRGDNT
jgi:dTDP-glucose 4,6-dehydratase